jgi:hypothetical protein
VPNQKKKTKNVKPWDFFHVAIPPLKGVTLFLYFTKGLYYPFEDRDRSFHRQGQLTKNNLNPLVSIVTSPEGLRQKNIDARYPLTGKNSLSILRAFKSRRFALLGGYSTMP